MTGACLTVSQVQSIPWSAAPSSTSLLLVTSVFVTPIVTSGVVAKPSAMRAAAVLPVSFREKETGAGWRWACPVTTDAKKRYLHRYLGGCHVPNHSPQLHR